MLRWITYLNIKPKTITLLEENKGRNLHDLDLGKDFLDMIHKRTNCWLHFKILKFCSLKYTYCLENEKTSQIPRENICISHIWIKGLYPEYIEDSQNSTIRKHTTQLKRDKRLEQTLHQRSSVDGRRAHEKMLILSLDLGKCKLRPQCGNHQMPIRIYVVYKTVYRVLARQRKSWSTHFLLGIRCYSHLEKECGSFMTAYFSLMYLFLGSRNEDMCPHKGSCLSLSVGLLVMAPKWKLIVPSNTGGELVDGLWYYPSDGGCYLAFKKGPTIAMCYIMNESQHGHAQWGKPSKGEYILYESI